MYGSVLMGHCHSVDQAPIPGLEPRIGRCIGCLCKLDQDYNRAQTQTLKQAHGWSYGLIQPSGEYIVFQAMRIANSFFVASDIREINAKKH